ISNAFTYSNLQRRFVTGVSLYSRFVIDDLNQQMRNINDTDLKEENNFTPEKKLRKDDCLNGKANYLISRLNNLFFLHHLLNFDLMIQ
ncbi:hypothetical protein BpHYR1_012274, partial [Brachionus plicatilis]